MQYLKKGKEFQHFSKYIEGLSTGNQNATNSINT